MAKVLVAVTAEPRERKRQLQQLASGRDPEGRCGTPLGEDQGAYCKEEGHEQGSAQRKTQAQSLAEGDSD